MSTRVSRLLLPVIYLGFISLGLPDGTFGVAWPSMHVALGAPIGVAGVLALAGTLCSAASSFASGRIIARFHTGPVVLVSCVLTAAGLLLMANAENVAWLWLATIPLAFGAGAVDTGLNGHVARHYSGRHMNWLHACWGIGATCGPLVMTHAFDGAGGWRGGYATLGVVQLSLAALFLLTIALWKAVPVLPVVASDQAIAHRAPTTLANSEAGWLSAAIFALYVGIESAAGLWAASILVHSRGAELASASSCAAAFYGSITVGRLLVGCVVDRWGNRRLIAYGTALALAGAVLFALAGDFGFAALALVMMGLGFAPVYPCSMHEVPRRFAPAAVQAVIGRQSGAAYLGAAFLPAAAGWLAQDVSLEGITWTVVGGVLVLITGLHRLNRIT